MMRQAWPLALLLLVACGGGREPLAPPAGPGASPSGGGTVEKVGTDAGAVTVAPSEPGTGMGTAPVSCDELAAGGAPDQLVDFVWNQQSGSCPSSACEIFVGIEDGCALSVQIENVAKTITMSAADCVAARGWVTNARFLDVIRNGTGCAGGAMPESFELTLLQEQPGRKTWGCDEPTVDLERQCLTVLAKRLYWAN